MKPARSAPRPGGTTVLLPLLVACTGSPPKLDPAHRCVTEPMTSGRAPPPVLSKSLPEAASLNRSPDGAIFGSLDVAEIPDELAELASSTVALLPADALSVELDPGHIDRWCGDRCGPNQQAFKRKIGHLPHAPQFQGGGVLVGNNVIAITRHSANNFKGEVSQMRAVFDFVGTTPTLRVFEVQDLYFPPIELGDVALARLHTPPGSPPAAVQEFIAPDSASTVRPALAFGHPLRVSRVMTGGAGSDAHLHDCRDHGGVFVHTTLDSLSGNSGSPVYVETSDPNPRWKLFGLFSSGALNAIMCIDGFCDVWSSEAHADTCAIPSEHGHGVGPIVVPLGTIEPSALDAVSRGQALEGWEKVSVDGGAG